MIRIENNAACFERLWAELEEMRARLAEAYRRYCIRRILQRWFPQADDDFIWEVCNKAEIGGMEALPPPALRPAPLRRFLQALVSVSLGIGMRQVNLPALDKAYRQAFPKGASLNINKR